MSPVTDMTTVLAEFIRNGGIVRNAQMWGTHGTYGNGPTCTPIKLWMTQHDERWRVFDAEVLLKEHPPKPCLTCGTPVVSTSKTLSRKVYCSDACRCRPTRDRACVQCGEPFTPARADAQFCSPACRQKAYRHRHAA